MPFLSIPDHCVNKGANLGIHNTYKTHIHTKLYQIWDLVSYGILCHYGNFLDDI